MAKKCVNLNAPEIRELHQQLNADVTSSSISPQLIGVNVSLWQEQNNTDDFPTLPELKEFMKVKESEKIQRAVVTTAFSPIERKQRVRYLANRFSEVVTALWNRDREAIREELKRPGDAYRREQLLHSLNVMDRAQFITQQYGVKQIWDLVKYNFLDQAILDPEVDAVTKEKKARMLEHFTELVKETAPILKATEGINMYVDSGVVKVSDSYQENMDEIDQKNDQLEQEEHSSKEDWDFRSEKTSGLDTLSLKVRSLLSAIPRVDINGQEEVDDLGTPIYLDMDIAHGTLTELLQGMQSVEDMIPILELHVKEFPWLANVIDSLRRSTVLRNLFYGDFNKTFIQYNYIDPQSNISKSLNQNIKLKPIIDKYNENINTGVLLSKDSIYTKDNAINASNVTSLKEKAIAAQTEYKKANSRAQGLTPSLKKTIGNLLHSIGVSYSPDALERILTSPRISNTKSVADPVNIIFNNAIQILSGLDSNPVKFSTELISTYKGKYNAIARLFFLEQGAREASFRQGGDSYYSYMLPNYLSKLVSGIKGTNFMNILQEKFKRFSFFYDKTAGRWMNGLLERLESDSEARERFGAHTLLSNKDGKSYMEWGFLDTIIVRMTEFGAFTNEKSNYAGFMVPVMSDAPKCYFMTLPKIEETTAASVREQALDSLTDVVMQEYVRINLVRQREQRMAAGENITPITNFDSRASKDKIGGAQFKIIPALNSYRVPLSSTESIPFLDRMDDLMRRKSLGEDVSQMILDETRDALSAILNNDFKAFLTKLKNEGAFTADDEGRLPFPGVKFDMTGIPALKKALEGVRNDLVRNRPEMWNDSFEAFYRNLENLSFDRIAEGVTTIKNHLNANKLPMVAKRIVYNNVLINKIENFFYNDLVASGHIYELLTTDLAFYPNLTDLSKRFKQVQGSTQKLAWEPGTKQRVVIMKDSDVPAGGLEQIKGIYDAAVRRGELTAQRRDQLLGKLSEITETDGQAITTLPYYKKLMQAGGNWNAELERVYQKMMSPREQRWTMDDYSVLFQIIKPFVYTQRGFQDAQSDEVMPVPFQNKNSIFVLTPQHAKGKPELEAMLQYMQEHNVDVVQFESAVKVGNQGNLELKGNTKEEILANLNNQTNGRDSQVIFEIDPNDFGVQVSTVPHFVDSEALVGSQLRKIEMKDIPDDATFPVKGEVLSKQELSKAINDIQLANQEEGLEGVREVFSSDERLSDEVTSELMKDGRFGPDAIRAVSLASDGKPVLPFFAPSRAAKIVAKLISIIKTRVSKQKMAGGAYIQATSLGIKSIQGMESYNGETLEVKFSPDGKRLEYIECLVPAWSKELFGPLMDPKTGLLDINKRDSAGNLILPEEARRMIAYRIPTENGYSILPLRIKGFLPQQGGGAIITNPLVFTLTGSDLDVDKLYFLRPSVQKKQRVSSEMVAALIDEFSPYDEVTTDTFRKVRAFAERALEDKPVELNDIESKMYDYIQNHMDLLEVGFDVIPYGNIKDAAKVKDKRARDNALFDAYWSIMTSESYAQIATRPGNFDSLKHAARIATILNNPDAKVPGSIDALTKMSIKELEALIDNTLANPLSPAHIVDVQVRNTVGKNLIAIIANHNAHYAATQGMNLKVGSKYQFSIDDSILDDVSKPSVGTMKLSLALCEYLAAIVDNAKDPVLGDMGITPVTINAAMAMVRSGFSPVQIALFLNQPSIKRALAAYNKDTSSYKDITDFVDKQIGEYTNARNAFAFAAGEKWYPNYEFKSSTLFQNIKTSRESQGMDAELMKAKKGDASYAQYLESQLSALFAFKKSLAVGDYLNKMITNSKFDTTNGSPSKSFSHVIKNILKLKNFYNAHTHAENPIISGELLVKPTIGKGEATKKAIEESHLPFIQGFYSNTYGVMPEIYGKYFPFLKDYMLNALDDLSRNSKRGELSEKEIDEYLEDYLTYKVSRLPSLGTEVLPDGTVMTAEEKRRYFINSFPKRFVDLRASIPELAQNDFIQRIKAYRAKSKDASGKPFLSPTLLFENSGGLNALDRERYTNAWRDMLYSDNADVRQLAVDMFKYAYYKNGLGFGPTSWMHLVPIEVEFSIDGYRDELMRIQEEEGEDMDGFTEQFILNHTDNRNIISYAPEQSAKDILGSIENGTFTIDIQDAVRDPEGNQKWLVSDVIGDVIIFKKIVGVMSGNTPKIFRLISETEDTVSYAEVSKLGVRNAYKEYSYGADITDMKSQVGEYTEGDNVLNTGIMPGPAESQEERFDIAGAVAEANIMNQTEAIAPDMPMPDLADLNKAPQNLEDYALEDDCPF